MIFLTDAGYCMSFPTATSKLLGSKNIDRLAVFKTNQWESWKEHEF